MATLNKQEVKKDIVDAEVKKDGKKWMKELLRVWPLMSTGPHQLDRDNPKEVSIAQNVLTKTGYYSGQINGSYDILTDNARWAFVRDTMKNPDFSWELIKKSATDIGDLINNDY
jgi:hypothetical protein